MSPQIRIYQLEHYWMRALPPIMEETVQELHSPIGIVDEEVQPPLGVVIEEKTKHVGTPNVNSITRSTKTTMDQMTETCYPDQV